MKALLKLRPRPNGVFCYNDPMATGAMQAILEGLSVAPTFNMRRFCAFAYKCRPGLRHIGRARRKAGAESGCEEKGASARRQFSHQARLVVRQASLRAKVGS
jgi:hypothetical protein